MAGLCTYTILYYIIMLPEYRDKCCRHGSNQKDVENKECVEETGTQVVIPAQHHQLVDEASQTHHQTDSVVHEQNRHHVLFYVQVFLDVNQNSGQHSHSDCRHYCPKTNDPIWEWERTTTTKTRGLYHRWEVLWVTVTSIPGQRALQNWKGLSRRCWHKVGHFLLCSMFYVWLLNNYIRDCFKNWDLLF